MCGLPGSGKTTLSRRLEEEHRALRLTPDEWIGRLLSPTFDSSELARLRDPVEALLWDLAARVLSVGVDVILDFGLWAREERDDFRSRAAAIGARSEVCFLQVSRDELLRRLAARNADLSPGTFHIDEADLDGWLNRFEPPTADELVRTLGG
jgi:predicted kinase